MAFDIFLFGFRRWWRRWRRQCGIREEDLAELLEKGREESWGVEGGVDEVVEVPVFW